MLRLRIFLQAALIPTGTSLFITYDTLYSQSLILDVLKRRLQSQINDMLSGTSGYIARDDRKKEIVVALRGKYVFRV